MKPLLSAALILCALGLPAVALDASDLERCKKIDLDGPRLACFDAIAANLESKLPQNATSTPPPSSTGAWEVIVDVDPISDEQIVTAIVVSEVGNAAFRKPTLVVRCKGGSPDVFISWGDFLGDENVVTFRIDDDEPLSTSWSQSTDQTASFAYQPVELLRSMRSAKKVSARVTPYRSGPVTGIFHVDGLDGLLTTHGEVCRVT